MKKGSEPQPAASPAKRKRTNSIPQLSDPRVTPSGPTRWRQAPASPMLGIATKDWELPDIGSASINAVPNWHIADAAATARGKQIQEKLLKKLQKEQRQRQQQQQEILRQKQQQKSKAFPNQGDVVQQNSNVSILLHGKTPLNYGQKQSDETVVTASTTSTDSSSRSPGSSFASSPGPHKQSDAGSVATASTVSTGASARSTGSSLSYASLGGPTHGTARPPPPTMLPQHGMARLPPPPPPRMFSPHGTTRPPPQPVPTMLPRHGTALIPPPPPPRMVPPPGTARQPAPTMLPPPPVTATQAAPPAVPKAILYQFYGKKPRRKQLSNDDYFAWNNGGKPHELKFTAIFQCPLTGECFPSGRYGDPRFYEVKVVQNNYGADVEQLWYTKKAFAEHGAAARCHDCLLYREALVQGDHVVNSLVRMGTDPPYVKDDSRPMPAMPNLVAEKIKENSDSLKAVMAP